MSENLSWLYEQYTKYALEYATAKDRLEKLTATIISFGGTLPDVDDIDMNNAVDVATSLSDELYPKDGTWKEKILYALKRLDKPSHATEVAEYLLLNERLIGGRKLIKSNIQNVTTVMMSKMGKDGEIAVDNSEFKNKYTLL